MELFILREGEDGSPRTQNSQSSIERSTTLLQVDQGREQTSRKPLPEEAWSRLLEAAGLHQTALSKPFVAFDSPWSNSTSSISTLPAKTNSNPVRSQQQNEDPNNEQIIRGNGTPPQRCHLVCTTLFGFIQRSLTQDIPRTKVEAKSLFTFSNNFFFSPSFFPINFIQSLKNIIHKIKELSKQQTITTAELTPIEIIVEDYDPDYRRFNIRLVINGITVSFGHLNPHNGVCTFEYAKIVALTFNFNRFRQLGQIAPFHQDLQTLIRWVDTSYLFDLFTNFKNKNQQQWTEALFDGTTTAQAADVHKLEQMRVVSSVPADKVDNILLFAQLFKVPKADGISARSVYNGQQFDSMLNLVLKSISTEDKTVVVPPMPPLSIRSVVKQLLHGWSHISMIDFTSFFFQIEIHPALGNLLGAKVSINNKLKYYKMKALPMGITFSPALAQHIALQLKHCIKVLLAHISFDMIVWIDNILILTNTEDDNRTVRNEYDKLLKEVGIVAKKWEFPDSNNNITALGLEINLQQKTIKPSQKSIEKLKSTFDSLKTTATAQSFFVFQGLIMWMCYLGNIPLCEIPQFMTVVRNESRWLAQFTSRSTSVPWMERRKSLSQQQFIETAQDVFNKCINIIVTGPSTSLPPAMIHHTDASTQALAGISLCNSIGFSLKLKSCHRVIHIVEILAGALQSVMIRNRFPFAKIPWLWVTDNTVAKFAVTKAHSASDLAEEVLRFWLEFGLFPTHVMWVPTTCMRADGLTRPESFVENLKDLNCCQPNHNHEVHEVPSWTT
jgi:hypothetical protein